MVWNKNTPAFNEPISQGDNRIRELKADLQTIFRKDFKNPNWQGQPNTSYHKHLVNSSSLEKDGVIKISSSDVSSDYKIFKIQVYYDGAWRDVTLPTFQHKLNFTHKRLFEPGDIIVVFGNVAPTGWVQVSIQTVFGVTLNEIMLGLSNNVKSKIVGDFSLSSNITHSHSTSSEFLTPSHNHQGSGQVSTSGTNDGKEAYKIGGGDDIIKLHHYHIHSYSVSSKQTGNHIHTISSYTTGNYKRANFILVRKS